MNAQLKNRHRVALLVMSHHDVRLNYRSPKHRMYISPLGMVNNCKIKLYVRTYL